MTDEELIKGCIEGGRKYQQTLFDKYSGKMMAVCLRYSNNHEDAMDIMQDGFVKIFERLGSYKHTGSFEGWIRRVIVNTALDHLRKNKNLKYMLEVESVEYMLPAKENITSDLAANDLMAILQEIPAGYRTVFNMYAIEGYSHKEIAKALDVSVNTSKSQYSRAKGFLRNIIEKRNLL